MNENPYPQSMVPRDRSAQTIPAITLSENLDTEYESVDSTVDVDHSSINLTDTSVISLETKNDDKIENCANTAHECPSCTDYEPWDAHILSRTLATIAERDYDMNATEVQNKGEPSLGKFIMALGIQRSPSKILSASSTSTTSTTSTSSSSICVTPLEAMYDAVTVEIDDVEVFESEGSRNGYNAEVGEQRSSCIFCLSLGLLLLMLTLVFILTLVL